MPKGKPNSKTPISPAKVQAWLDKAALKETKAERDARMFAQLSDRSDKAEPAIPEELETVWDKDVAEVMARMKPKHQDFLLCYIREGNAAAAYRKVYNPLAKDHLAAVGGSQLLTTNDIHSVLLKFASQKTEALFTVIQGYRDMAQATKADWVKDESGQYENAGDTPDWQARKEALLGLRKIHGLDSAEKSEVKVSSEVVIVELPKKK